MAGYSGSGDEILSLWDSGRECDRKGDTQQALEIYRKCVSMLPALPENYKTHYTPKMHIFVGMALTKVIQLSLFILKCQR